MEPSSPELTPQEPLEERIRHYQSRAERLLRRHGTDFAGFTGGYEQLVAIGEERLKTFETTGITYCIVQMICQWRAKDH